VPHALGPARVPTQAGTSVKGQARLSGQRSTIFLAPDNALEVLNRGDCWTVARDFGLATRRLGVFSNHTSSGGCHFAGVGLRERMRRLGGRVLGCDGTEDSASGPG